MSSSDIPRQMVASLVDRFRSGASGQRVVILGVGGTGKTVALRALASGRPPEDVTQLRSGRSTLIAGLARAEGSSLVLVDDIDRGSADELTALTAFSHSQPAIDLVVASRPSLANTAVARLLSSLAEDGEIRRLGELDDQELAFGVASVLGVPADRALIDALATSSGRNPRLAGRLIDLWQGLGVLERGHLVLDPPSDLVGLDDALLVPLGQLGSKARVLLAELVILGIPAAGEQLALRHPTEFAQLHDTGLLGAARLAPVVVASMRRLLGRAELVEAGRRAAHTLAQLEASTVDVASQLWSVRANDEGTAAAYIRAGDEILAATTADPAGASVWYRRALQLDNTNVAAHLGAARAATASGDAPAALAAAAAVHLLEPTNAAATALVAAAFAGRSLWAEAATELERASAASDRASSWWLSQARLCRLLANQGQRSDDAPPLLGAGELAASLTSQSAAVLAASWSDQQWTLEAARERIVEMAAAHSLVRCPIDVAVEPAEVAASVALAFGDLALAGQLLSQAPRRGHRRAALERLHAWVLLRQGEQDASYAAATDAVVADDRQTADLVSLAIRAATARRNGDIAAGAAVARALDGNPNISRIDALTLDAAGELLVLARRFGPTTMADRLERRIDIVVEGRSSPLWAARVWWSRLEAAVHTRRNEDVALAAEKLSAAAALVPHLQPLAEAAAVWVDLLRGTVDRDRLERAVAALVELRFPWEAAHLAGQAAIRVTDAVVAKSLLVKARNVRANAASAGRGDGDRPITKAGLSEREVEVARLVIEGRTHKDIGATLYISPKTVEHHAAHIRQKLGATNRAEMLAFLNEDLASVQD